jgi:hypothetical protein
VPSLSLDPADDGSAHLPTTLIFLAILIAAVTQVISDNVAGLSLVGALGIVRFRTVVRTRETAFVIFSVVVGMAVERAGWWWPWRRCWR